MGFTRFSLSILSIFLFNTLLSAEPALPDRVVKIMQQEKYKHSTWGIYFKDSETGNVLYDLNSEQMLLPASTTKLFSVLALLQTYGDNYRFKTPVFALGSINDGVLNGDLVLVAQGDLTFGGRQNRSDKISFTKLDHIIANEVPGVILTTEDPLYAIKDLAKQIRAKGIKEIAGEVLIDDRLFQQQEARGMQLTPMIINENLIDIVINPGDLGKYATISWRPEVEGYDVRNEVKTVSKDEALEIQITSDKHGENILVKGTIPINQRDIVRTFSIKDASHFAKSAFMQALREQGITLIIKEESSELPSQSSLQHLEPIATWTSPPLSEYAKLILKVSHNLGADLVPLLLAVHNGKTSFNDGMLYLGQFITEKVKIPSDTFVFVDGAGGDGNRVTPKAIVQLLEYVRKLPAEQFQNYMNALPILGVDGSLADFAKKTTAVGKVRAKTGTGVSFNLANGKFFLTTQTLGGYIEGKNGHLIEFMLAVNNAQMPAIEDVLAIFEDLSQITAIVYEISD